MNRASSSLLLLAAAASSTHAQNWLDTATVITKPQAGEAFGVGDHDGDGNADILHFNGALGFASAWTGFQVLFGDGTGRFTSGPTTTLPGSGHSPRKLPLVDLDGDGVCDVVVEKSTSPHALLIYRGFANGTFAAPISFALPNRIEAIAVGDNDSDGVFEIATANRTTIASNSDFELRWWNWNGSTFQPSASVLLPTATSGDFGLAGIACLDANGDGSDDIAVGESAGSDVRILITSAGNPTLGPSITALFAGPRPLTSDIDHDGDDDLVVTGTFVSSVLVQPIEQTAPLVFAPGVSSLVLPASNGLERPQYLADWDGDGDDDILAPSTSPFSNLVSSLAILENDGTSFFLAGRIRCGEDNAGNQYGAGPADFDHDGNLDFATLNGVAFGSGRIEDSYAPLGTISLSALNGRVLDWEGDGDVDIVRDAMGGIFAGGGPVFLNDARGKFDSQTIQPLAPPSGLQWGTNTANPVIRSLGNFAGGPGPDALAVVGTIATSPFVPSTFHHMRLLVNDELGHLVDGGVASTDNMSASSLVPFDVDGNGALDVLGSQSGSGGYWPNLGNGKFGAFVSLFPPTPLHAFDADLDGDRDFIALTASFLLAYMRNDGTSFSQFDLTSLPTGGGQPDLIDFDADGDLDLIYGTGSAPGPALILLRNDGIAGFTQVASLPSELGILGRYAFDDVNRDGIRDLLVSTPSTTSLRILVFPGLGPAFSFGPFSRFFGGAFDFADIDQDGDIDAIGQGIVRNRNFDGPDDGTIRQYGVNSIGSGNAKPVLGATGPARPGSTTASLRVRLGLGGAPAFFLIGFGATSLPGFGVPGFTLQVSPLYNIIPIPLAGAPGAPGQGSFDFPTSPLIPTVAGLSIFHQFAIIDPAAQSSVSFTNGLEIHYGL